MHHFARSLVPVAARQLLPRCPKKVVVIGGGPAGIFCADRLRHHFEVTLIDSKEYYEYTPGILRALVEPAHHSRITFDYREVLEESLGIEFICGDASKIDLSSDGGNGGSVRVRSRSSVGPRSVGFDYCVVAVGVSNGRWKPRMDGEEVRSQSPAPVERELSIRRDALRAWREDISRSRRAVVVGAGQVGVELAAELAHFQPRSRVKLVDASSTVLAQLAEGARSYAHSWLQQHSVKLFLGKPFVPDMVADDDHVLWCVGTKARGTSLFGRESVYKANGQIRVNQRMQVVKRLDDGSSLADPIGLGSSLDGPTPLGGSAAEIEPIGQGRVYAVGDTAAVQGVPTAQIIYHGEEMAAVAVANIEAAEDIFSPLTVGAGKREVDPGLLFFCATSLGPQDGMFSTQSELVATGALAALQKQFIETSKMRATKGDPLSSLLWLPVH